MFPLVMSSVTSLVSGGPCLETTTFVKKKQKIGIWYNWYIGLCCLCPWEFEATNYAQLVMRPSVCLGSRSDCACRKKSIPRRCISSIFQYMILDAEWSICTLFVYVSVAVCMTGKWKVRAANYSASPTVIVIILAFVPSLPSSRT